MMCYTVQVNKNRHCYYQVLCLGLGMAVHRGIILSNLSDIQNTKRTLRVRFFCELRHRHPGACLVQTKRPVLEPM